MVLPKLAHMSSPAFLATPPVAVPCVSREWPDNVSDLDPDVEPE